MTAQNSLPPSDQVISDVVAAVPLREAMWSPVGIQRHLLVVAALWLVTIIANCNTLTQRYVLMDRSGFTLDSKYIIELDPRSRTLQFEDRVELQKKNLGDLASAMQSMLLYQSTADFKAIADEGNRLADLKQVSEYGWKNYFKQDYWWPKGISGLYRPLTSLSYWYNFGPIREKSPAEWDAIYKEKPEDYYRISASALKRFHWTNTLLHAFAATLVYFVVLSVANRFWVAAFAAAMYSTHPITVESVANIIGRADIFAAISVFGTLLLYIRSTKVSGIRRLPWLLSATLLTTLGVFAKESALAAAPVVAFYELIFCYHPRIAGLFQNRRGWFDDATRWFGDFLAACIRFAFRGWVFLVPPVVIVFLVRAWVFSNSTPAEEPFLDNPIRGNPYYGLNENLLIHVIESRVTALKVVVLLFGKLILPIHLSSDYSFNEIAIFNHSLATAADFGALLAALVVFGFVVLACWFWSRGRKAPAFFIFFYFWAMMPTANLVKVIGSIMAERFMYLPLLGFVGGLSLLVFHLADRFFRNDNRPWLRYAPHTLLSLIIVLYTGRTLARNFDWQSDEMLWKSALGESPNAFRSYQSYAFAIFENGQVDLQRKYTAVETLQRLRDDANKTVADGTASAESKAAAQRVFDQATAALPRAESEFSQQRETYRKQIQQMIDVDEKGLRIVDVLPPEMNSARLYLHLGMYYAEMGKMLQDPQRPNDILPVSREWFQKSVDILSRAVPIDRAFSQLNKRKEVTRGRAYSTLPEAGLAPVYMVLGENQMRLGKFDDALETFRYVQMLDPSAATSYVKIGAIRLNQSRIDDAISSLIQGVLLDASQNDVWPMLKSIYDALRTPNALMNNNGQVQLNSGEPVVRQHIQTAMRDLVRTLLRAKQFDFARTIRNQGINIHHMPAAAFDSLFIDSGATIDAPTKDPAAAEQRWRRATAVPAAAEPGTK